MALTLAQLRQIMPAASSARLMQCLPPLNLALIEFEITTIPRVAAFLAQIAHETLDLKYLEEIWGPTPQQKKYEPPNPLALKLGNTEKGDGRRFKGRGPFQLTGRANYKMASAALGIDMVAVPELAAHPETGFRIAGWFWNTHQLSALADVETVESFQEITRRINGGMNGWDSRLKCWARAKEVLKGDTPHHE
jgi:predicted chitinase